MSRWAVSYVLAACFLAPDMEAQETSPNWTVRAGGGLGVGVVSMPALADYVNAVASTSRPTDEFTSVAELVLFAEYRISREWSAGVSWGRIAKTLEPAGTGGWTFDATVTTPMAIVRRAVDAGGMQLWLTVGAGPAHGEIVQSYGPLGSDQHFSGSGLGLLAGAAAFAPLADHVVAGINADLRWTSIGGLTDAAGRGPTYRGATADLRWMQATLQFLIAATL